MQSSKKFMSVVCLSALISACGGGGGGGTPAASVAAPSTLTFPIQTGIRALTANGLSKNFTVSGSCTGSGTRTSSAATTPATFESIVGFSSTTTLTINAVAPCTSIAQTSTSYVDSNYVATGFNSIGVNYGVYLIAPSYPSSVTVGSTGVIGTETLYTNSSKSVPNGTSSSSYVVTADPASSSTAIVNLITKGYSVSSTLQFTEQDYYRVDALGTLTPLYVDLLYANGSHLVLTYN